MTKTEESCIRDCANVNLINRAIEDVSLYNDQIEISSKLFNLVGNETRLKILFIIKNEKEVCVCDLSDILNISVSAISQQLRKLKDGNLLKKRKDGQTIYYTLNEDWAEIIEHLFTLFNSILIKKVA